MRIVGQSDGRTVKAAQLPLLQSDRPTVRLSVLDERLRGTKFVQLTPRSVLNSPQQTGVDFWSINPYIGCEFGCTYCYARYAHRYAVKRVEARSPMPAVRLRALQRLADAGIRAGLIVAPVLPGITDDVPHLEALFQAAREAGAQFVHAGPLRLYRAVRERFLPVLDESFPGLSPRYRQAYRSSGAPRAYATALAARIKSLQQRFGFPVNRGMVDRYRPRRTALQAELDL